MNHKTIKAIVELLRSTLGEMPSGDADTVVEHAANLLESFIKP